MSFGNRKYESKFLLEKIVKNSHNKIDYLYL